MYYDVNEINDVTWVIDGPPEEGAEVVELPEDGSADYENQVVQDGQSHKNQPLSTVFISSVKIK